MHEAATLVCLEGRNGKERDNRERKEGQETKRLREERRNS